MPKYELLPQHMQDAFRLYIEKGIPPGSFTQAFLANDLMGAMRRADHINQNNFYKTCCFLETTPIGCHGSPEHVQEWIKVGGLEGMDAA